MSTTASRSHLLSPSFLNDDGKMVTVVMNRSDEDITYNLIFGRSETKIDIPANGIQTLVY